MDSIKSRLYVPNRPTPAQPIDGVFLGGLGSFLLYVITSLFESRRNLHQIVADIKIRTTVGFFFGGILNKGVVIDLNPKIELFP